MSLEIVVSRSLLLITFVCVFLCLSCAVNPVPTPGASLAAVDKSTPSSGDNAGAGGSGAADALGQTGSNESADGGGTDNALDADALAPQGDVQQLDSVELADAASVSGG